MYTICSTLQSLVWFGWFLNNRRTCEWKCGRRMEMPRPSLRIRGRWSALISQGHLLPSAVSVYNLWASNMTKTCGALLDTPSALWYSSKQNMEIMCILNVNSVCARVFPHKYCACWRILDDDWYDFVPQRQLLEFSETVFLKLIICMWWVPVKWQWWEELWSNSENYRRANAGHLKDVPVRTTDNRDLRKLSWIFQQETSQMNKVQN